MNLQSCYRANVLGHRSLALSRPWWSIYGRSMEDLLEDLYGGIGDNSDMRTCVIINIVRVIVILDVEGGLFSKGGRFERF